MKRLALAALAAGSFFAAPTLAANGADPSGLDIVTLGKRGALAPCSVCHGIDGASRAGSGTPRIGGLNAEYMLHEFESALTGARGGLVMAPIVRALTPAERKAVTDYYAQQNPPLVAEDVAADAVARGRRIAERGDWSRDLPPCQTCHGTAGMGIGAHFPRLNGQLTQYVEAQLRDWQTSKRHDDPMGLMQGVARRLTAGEIADVAAYFAALPGLPALPAMAPAQPAQMTGR